MISIKWSFQSIFYILSLMLFFLSSSIIVIWIFMEINLLMFLFFLYKMELSNFNFFKMGLFYFLIQSLGSVFFLLFLMFDGLEFIFNLNFLFLFLSLTIKIGLYPLHFWIYEISSLLSSASLFFILTLQKIPYFMILFTLFPNSGLICFFSFVMGSILLYFSKSLDSLLISSSISSIIWVNFLFLESFLSFLSFFFFYCFFLYPILFFNVSWRGFHLGNLKFFVAVSLSFMFFLGLPPFSLFFLKFSVINFISSYLGEIMILSLVLLSVLSLSGYFKFFFKDLTFIKFLYSLSLPSKKNFLGSSILFITPLLFTLF